MFERAFWLGGAVTSVGSGVMDDVQVVVVATQDSVTSGSVAVQPISLLQAPTGGIELVPSPVKQTLTAAGELVKLAALLPSSDEDDRFVRSRIEQHVATRNSRKL